MILMFKFFEEDFEGGVKSTCSMDCWWEETYLRPWKEEEGKRESGECCRLKRGEEEEGRVEKFCFEKRSNDEGGNFCAWGARLETEAAAKPLRRARDPEIIVLFELIKREEGSTFFKNFLEAPINRIVLILLFGKLNPSPIHKVVFISHSFTFSQ